MKYLDHLKRFKTKMELLSRLVEEYKSLKEGEIDYSIFFTEGHWAIYHLISALLDYLDIPENLKHKNHRSIKRVLLSNDANQKLGKEASLLNELYARSLEFVSKGEYGRIESVSNEDFKLFQQIILRIKEIIENYIGKMNEIK